MHAATIAHNAVDWANEESIGFQMKKGPLPDMGRSGMSLRELNEVLRRDGSIELRGRIPGL